MKILCKVGPIETMIVGYGPGKNGSPTAIVPWLDKDGQHILKSVPLSECVVLNVPSKLKKRLNKIHDKRHERNLKNTENYGPEPLVMDPNLPGGQVQ